VEAPAPELERAFDVAVRDTPSNSLVGIETGRTKSGAKDASPEMLAGEHIVPPPPVGSNLPVARLLTSCKVTGNPQHQPAPRDQGAAGSSSGGILVTPPKWQYAILTGLIEDPMLFSATLTEFQNTFKELYKFSTVSILY
jgi:hypothetical protein